MNIRILMALLLLVGAEVQAQQGSDILVAAARENPGGKPDTLHCKVQAPLDEVISSHAVARLSWVLAANSKVEKGQLIAKQDDYYLKQDEQALVLALERNQASLHWAEQNHNRVVEMQADLRSASQLDDALLQLKQAKIDHRNLSRQLEEIRYRLKHLQHYAPVNGELVSALSQPGEQLEDGQSILRIVPSDNRELNCRLPLALYHDSHVLQQATFSLENGVPLHLGRVSSVLSEKAQTLPLYFSLPEQGEYLTGQRLRVRMELPVDGVTQVPFDALNLVADGYYVWQFADNRVNKIPVEVISTKGNQALVKSTLVKQDKVVVKGKQGLEPGKKVKATDVGMW